MSSSSKGHWGKRLADKREELRFSKEELAARWRATTRNPSNATVESLAKRIERYEAGKTHRPRNPAVIPELALALGVDALWLETGQGQRSIPEVEDYLRTHHHKVKPDVAEALRGQPYEALLMSPPTVEDLEELSFALEQMIRHRRQRADGDKSG